MWTLIWMYYQNYAVYPKMSTIFSKNVRKQCLHACDFLHVCGTIVSERFTTFPGLAVRWLGGQLVRWLLRMKIMITHLSTSWTWSWAWQQSNIKYLSATLWDFLNIGIFVDLSYKKLNKKSKSMQQSPKKWLFPWFSYFGA